MNLVNHRLEYKNWLDPLVTSEMNGDSSFHRPDIFARPTAAELRAGWAVIGGTRIVNCFNGRQTDFPQLVYSELGIKIKSKITDSAVWCHISIELRFEIELISSFELNVSKVKLIST